MQRHRLDYKFQQAKTGGNESINTCELQLARESHVVDMQFRHGNHAGLNTSSAQKRSAITACVLDQSAGTAAYQWAGSVLDQRVGEGEHRVPDWALRPGQEPVAVADPGRDWGYAA